MDVLDLERRLIASFIRDKEYLSHALAAKMEPEHFETKHAKAIYSILKIFCTDKADPEKIETLGFDALKLIVMSDKATNFGILDPAPVIKYIDGLKNIEDSDSISFTVDWLMEYLEKRRLAQALSVTYKSLMSGQESPLQALGKLTQDCLGSFQNVMQPPDDLEAGFIERFQERDRRIKQKANITVPTGFDILDAGLDGGMRSKEMYIVAGYPGVGKSFFCDCVGVQAFEKGFDVLKITTENTREQSLGRTEALYWRLNYRALQSCDINLDPEQIAGQMPKRANRHFTIRLFPDEDSVGDLIWKMELLKIQKGFKPQLLVIDSPDFLKLPQSHKGDKRTYQLTETYLALKRQIELNDQVVLATSHVKLHEYKGRRQKRNDRLDLGDLSDTSGKARLADGLWTLNTNDELMDTGRMELYVAKSRDVDRRPFSVILKREYDNPRLIEDV